MKKPYLSYALAGAAAVLIVLSIALPDSPIWISITAMVLAILAVVFAPKGWKKGK